MTFTSSCRALCNFFGTLQICPSNKVFLRSVCWLFTSGGYQPLLVWTTRSSIVIVFRVKALSYLELLNHSQHFAALSQLSSHDFCTLLLEPSESPCSRLFGFRETNADLFAGPGGALAVEDVEKMDAPTNEIPLANLQLQAPWQKRHLLQPQLHL